MIKNKNWFMRHPIWTGVIGFFLFIIIISLFLSDVSNDSSSPTKTNTISIGEQGKLYLEGSSVVPVCVTKSAFNELLDASYAKDEIGYRNLLMSPKCYVASTLDDYDIPGATYGDVLILDRTIGLTKFRFTNPNALHYGESAWTNYGFVIPN